MVREISITAGVLVLLCGIALAQSPAEEGAAVRKAFKACESAEWHGNVEVPLEKVNNHDSSNSMSVRLDCAAYLKWWDMECGASPFTILNERRQIYREIPPNIWMKYLQLLPFLNAETKPDPLS